MMCRHLLPRFDLPLGRTLHGLGRFAVVHPTLAAAVVLLPLCAGTVIVICRDPRRPSVARWRGIRPGPNRRLPKIIGDRFGPAHSG